MKFLQLSTNKSIYVTILVCLLSAFMVPGTNQAASQNTFSQLSPEEESWLQAHPQITVAINNSWAPMDFVDSTGAPQGIGVDFIRALNERLGNRLQIVPGPWKQIYQQVKEGQLDALMDISPREERKPFFNFTTPYVEIPHLIVGRKTGSYFQTLADLQGKILAAEEGFFITEHVRRNYPSIQILELSNTTDALDAVAKGKADAYVGNRAVAFHLINKELLPNLQFQGKIKATESINSIGVRKDWPLLTSILEKTLETISLKEKQAIFNKWIGYSGAGLALSNEEKRWIKEHPEIRIAFDGDYAPYSFQNDKGEFFGIAVDFAQELANRAGLKLKVHPEGSWKQLYKAALNREVDVIATLVKRPDRFKSFNFSAPYISLAQYVITREDTNGIKRRDHIAGKKLALVESYSTTRHLLENYPTVKPLYVANLTQALEAVSTGKAEATVAAMGMAQHVIATSGLPNLKFSVLYGQGLSEQRFGVRKDWSELSSILEKALATMTEDERLQIYQRWSRPSIARIETMTPNRSNELLTGEELAWLRAHPVLRVGESSKFEPLYIKGPDGSISGILPDMYQLVADRLGVQFEFVDDEWPEILRRTRESEIDIIGQMNGKVARTMGLLTTSSPFNNLLTVFAKKDREFEITDDKDMEGLRVAYYKDIILLDKYFESRRSLLEPVKADSPLDAIRFVLQGMADVMVGFNISSYLLTKYSITDIEPVYVLKYPPIDEVTAIRPDASLLVSILHKTFASIGHEERNSILARWTWMVGPDKMRIPLSIEEQAWLQDHPVIELYTNADSPPFQFVTESGRMSGILVDYVAALEKRLGVDIQITPVSMSKFNESYLHGDSLLSGFSAAGLLQPDAPYQRTTTILKGYISLFGKGMRGVKINLDNLEGKTIATTGSQDRAHEIVHLLSQRNSIQYFEHTEDLIGALLTGKVDFVIHYSEIFNYYLRRAQVSDIYTAYTWHQADEGVLFVHQDAPHLLTILNKAIAHVEGNELSQILFKWYGHQVDEPKIELTATELSWLTQNPVIPMAVDSTAPPMSFLNDKGDYTGVLKDIFTEVEKLLGIQFSYEPVEYGELVEKVKKGEQNVVSGIDPVDAPYEDYFLRSRDLIFAPFALFALDGHELALRGIDALSGKRIALLKGWDLSHPALKQFEECELVFSDTPIDLINLLLSGKADAIYDVGFLIDNILTTRNIRNVRIIHSSQFGMPFNILIKKEWAPFHSALEKALATFSENHIFALLQKWNASLDDPAYQFISTRLTEKERFWLKQHQVIRVGADADWAPMEFLDEDDTYQGFSIDYLNRIAQILGIRFEFIREDWQQLIKMAKQQQLDMFSCVAQTPERDKYLLFTDHYVDMPAGIFTRKGVRYISDIGTISGQKVAVVEGYAIHDHLVADYSELDLVLVKNPDDGIRTVLAGEAFAYIDNVITTEHLLNREGYVQIQMAGEIPFRYSLRFGVRKDWPILRDIIQKADDQIPAAERNALYNQWVPLVYDRPPDYSLIWKLFAGAFLLIVLVGLWNWRLSREVVQRKRVEETIQAVNRELAFTKFAFDNAPDGIEWLRSDNADMVYVNKQTSKMLDYSQEELLNLSVFDFDPVHNKDYWTDFRKELQAKGHMTFESKWQRKGGEEYPVEISARSLTYEGEEFFIAFIRDITEQKELKKNLQNRIDELDQTRKEMVVMMEDLEEARSKAEEATEAKSEFLANMSHEIRTPMNAVIGMSHLVMQTDLTYRQKDYVNKIATSAKSLLSIINDILDFSKIEAGKLTIEKTFFNLSEILDEIIILSADKLAEKDVELLLDIDEKIPSVLIGDPVRVSQVFNNLINNAAKFTHQGEVEINCRVADIQTESVTLACSVSDTGIGMTPEQTKGLFQKFTQADATITRKYGGTGLGLAISHQLINLMEGEIQVKSSRGEGSIFTFTLPLGHRPERRKKGEIRPLPLNLRNLKVLLVEEDNKRRAILVDRLQSFAFKVDVQKNCEEGCAAFEDALKKRNPYELIILDHRLLIENKEKFSEVLESTKELNQTAMIIMAAVNELAEAEAHAQMHSMAEVLIKPVTRKNLYNAIVQAFGYSSLRIEKRRELSNDILSGLNKIQGASVLLAEDNKVNQQIVSELLGRKGVNITIAENGKQALEQIRQKDFDLVLMDIQMPEMDGLTATREIRKWEAENFKGRDAYEEIPIIAMTAHAMAGDREKSLKAGMNDHIVKPIEPKDLYVTLIRFVKPTDKGQDLEIEAQPENNLAEETNSEFPVHLAGIDLDNGLKRVAGNKKLYLRLLRDFCKENEGFSTQINRALKDEDIATACRLAHTLKGSAGNIGAVEMQEKALLLETAIENEEADLDIRLVNTLNELQDILNSIQHAIPAEQVVLERTATTKPIDKEVLGVSIDNLRRLLENNDMEAEKIFQETKAPLSNLHPELVDQLTNYLDSYNFEEALKIVIDLSVLLKDEDEQDTTES